MDDGRSFAVLYRCRHPVADDGPLRPGFDAAVQPAGQVRGVSPLSRDETIAAPVLADDPRRLAARCVKSIETGRKMGIPPQIVQIHGDAS